MMKNKLTSFFLALVIAFGLWAYVITSVSPGSEDTFYNIPVAREGESLLQERGLMITSISDTNVSLTLSGTRKDLAKVNSGNITLKVDLSKIYDPGIHSLEFNASYPGDVPSNAFVEESRYPESITVVVEERRTKEVPVEVKWVGKASEGFLTDKENRVLDYPFITVTGPASVADEITKAVIEVDLTEQRESISQSYRYTLCNAENEPVDAHLITTNVQEVRLDVKIQRFMDLKLTYQVIEGGGAAADNAHISLSVDTIRVSGSDAALEVLGDELLVATLNLAEIPRNTVLTYPINLPEGVTNLSGVEDTDIKIYFSGLSTRNFTIEKFTFLNVPEGMEVELFEQELSVDIRGSTNLMQRLALDNIHATIDFAGAEAETATYKVVFTFDPEFASVGPIPGAKPYTVSATIRPIEEE